MFICAQNYRRDCHSHVTFQANASLVECDVMYFATKFIPDQTDLLRNAIEIKPK